MNIIITGNFFFPTGMAASARIRNLAKGFRDNGANVYIIATSPPFKSNVYPIHEI
ncbi:MAG: hypothetical protein P1U70_09755 [Saprospiraceae bacterium]|nr:hypothetical protein [Saprospiraceae bacterium]